MIWEGRTLVQIETDPPQWRTHPAMTLHAGDPYQTETLRTMLKALYATGGLEDVRVEATLSDGNGVTLRLIFTEKQVIAALSVSGNHFISDAQILKAAGLQPGDPFTEARWETAAEGITALYQRAGYYQAHPVPHLNVNPNVNPNIQGRPLHLTIEMKEGNRARIRALHFDFASDPFASPRALRLRMRSQPGEYFNADLLQKDLERLISFYTNRGHLKAAMGTPIVDFLERENSVDITVPVDPSDQIDLIFENPAPFSSKQLRDAVGIQEEKRDDNEVLEESARRIAKRYHLRGYPKAEVAVSSRQIAPRHREVRFVIQRGPQTRIREIAFSGNAKIPTTRLSEILALKVGDPYLSDPLDEKVTALTQFYKKEGFGAAHVTGEVALEDRSAKVALDDPLAKVALEDRLEGASITFTIDEGIQTRIGVVKVTGDKSVPDGTLREALRPDMPYYPAQVKEGERLLTLAYAREGYLYATFETEVHLSPDETLAEITYRIHAGPQVHLGSITLEGNLRTRDRVLLREVPLASGALYRPQEILMSQRRLYRTGLFSSIRFEPIATADPQIQDLHLRVVERPALALSFGAGYAEHELFRGFLEVAHRNVWGTGNEISARAEANHIEEAYVLAFRQPWLFSQNIDGRASLSRITQREVTFDLETLRATAGIDQHFSETLKGTLRYEYEQHETSAVSPAVLQALEDTGKLNIATLNLSLIWDTRDDPFQPRSGRVYGATLRDAAKVWGSEVQLLKISIQGSGYRTLSDRLVVAASARIGIADRFGETVLIPPPERFFLGGRSTVRGYPADQLGIQDGPVEERTRIDGQPTGGNAFLLFNEEMRITLPRSWGLVFFLDHGNVWQRYTDIALSQIKSTVGAGVRYNTPVGPLRLDGGYKLNRESEEDAFAIHFTLGHAF